jgi:hypothetical protein
VDFNKLIQRAKSILLSPRSEWPVAAAEPATVGSLYTGYIMVLAAIPAIMHFLTLYVIGSTLSFLGAFHYGIGYGLSFALVSYALSLVAIYISAWVVDALAPSFGAEKNLVQALKSVAYAYTAVWVASIIGIVPGLGLLAVLAGVIYSIILLNMGLPFTMKCPPEKSVGYTAVSIIVTIVLSFIVNAVVGSILALGFGMSGGFAALGAHHRDAVDSSPTFEPGSTGAKLQAWSDSVDKASKQLDAANKSGDSTAQANAVGAMLGAALGSGGKVESLPADSIKPFLPQALAGLPRTQLNVQRNGVMGMQVSTGSATYSDGAGHTLDLEITDTGSLKGLVGFAAGYTGTEQDTETDSGYDKLYKNGDQLIHEKWDNKSMSGEYGTVVANRFSVSVSGNAGSINDLKSALGSVDLSGLAALRNSGVQSN